VSNLACIVNVISNQGCLTANHLPDGLFDTSDTQNRFAAHSDIGNEGSGQVYFALDVVETTTLPRAC
jgi:hypothetical protein